MKKLAYTIVFAVLASVSAQADQCQIIADKGDFQNTLPGTALEVANKAVELLNSAQQVELFCEPCGDTEPTPLEKSEARVARVEGGDFSVDYGDYELDLAYTYVDGANLAHAAGCDVKDVSERLPNR